MDANEGCDLVLMCLSSTKSSVTLLLLLYQAMVRKMRASIATR